MTLRLAPAPSGGVDTLALFDLFDSAQSGDTIVFPTGQTYIIDTASRSGVDYSPEFEIPATKSNIKVLGNGCTIIQNLNSTYSFLRLAASHCHVEGFTVKGPGLPATTSRVWDFRTTIDGYPALNRSCAIFLIGSNNVIKDVFARDLFVCVTLRGPITGPDGSGNYDYSGFASDNKLLNIGATLCDFCVTGSQQKGLIIDGMYFRDGTEKSVPPHAIYLFSAVSPTTESRVEGCVITNFVVENHALDEAIKVNNASGLTISDFAIKNCAGGITIGKGQDIVISSGTITDNYHVNISGKPKNAGVGLWFSRCKGVIAQDIYITGLDSGDDQANFVAVQVNDGSTNVRVENVVFRSNYDNTSPSGGYMPFRVTGHPAYGASNADFINCTYRAEKISDRTTYFTDTSTLVLDVPDIQFSGGEFTTTLTYDGIALADIADVTATGTAPLIAGTDYDIVTGGTTDKIRMKNTGSVTARSTVTVYYKNSGNQNVTQTITLGDDFSATYSLTTSGTTSHKAYVEVSAPLLLATDYEVVTGGAVDKIRMKSTRSVAAGNSVLITYKDSSNATTSLTITVNSDFSTLYSLATVSTTAHVLSKLPAIKIALASGDFEVSNATAGQVKFKDGPVLAAGYKGYVSATSSSRVGQANIVSPVLSGLRNSIDFRNAFRSKMAVTLDKSLIEGGYRGPAAFQEIPTGGDYIAKRYVDSIGATTKVVTLGGASGTVTMDATKTYALVKRADGEVTVEGTVAWTNVVSLSGTVRLNGLPYGRVASASQYYYFQLFDIQGLPALNPGESYVLFWRHSQTGTNDVPWLEKLLPNGSHSVITSLPTSGQFSFRGYYATADAPKPITA